MKYFLFIFLLLISLFLNCNNGMSAQEACIKKYENEYAFWLGRFADAISLDLGEDYKNLTLLRSFDEYSKIEDCKKKSNTFPIDPFN